ncbi:hypothetical protein H2201_008254 [Coniosporium apollinis]|uniref:Uncharacterized protein n=1 Tax=Coniosporium apollinis TaxID=61459 RepID=A0ABQ9NHF9_9PEZI|nr:hypothetical protein H2201_008254 [Coniosporium apollinis]
MICQEDLTPPRDVVNPEYNPSRTKVNWTIQEVPQGDGTQGQIAEVKHFRVLHLHGNDSHARFLTSAKPGHYAITIALDIQSSPALSDTDQQKLHNDGIGWLRVALGTLHDKKAFFTGRYREDTFDSISMTEESLPHKLLKDYWWDVIRIPIGQSVMQIQSDVVLSVEGSYAFGTDLGLIMQWSGVATFQNSHDAVTRLAVIHIRLDDLLEYDEPLVRAPPPTTSPTKPQTLSQSQPETTDADEEDSDGDDLSVEDWIQALSQIQQEVQDAQQRDTLEAILMQRLQQEEQERQEAVISALYLKAALQHHAREQEEKRKQEQALRLLQLLGLYYR